MIIGTHVQALRTASSSPRFSRAFSRGSVRLRLEDVRPRRRLLMALALFLLPLCQGKLVAQPPPPSEQGWSQSDSGMYAGGTYARYEQPAYSQPGYSQPYLQQRPRPQSYSSDPTYEQQGYQQQQYQQQAPVQPLGAEQLEQLVAPIALYPDVLLAQVLTASTYPDQVRYVDQWRQAEGNAPAEDIAAGADEKNWDPSLKALTAFPQVLAQMAGNFQWTSDLGNAYYNQPQDVLGAVQMMRHRAQAAGNLQSTPQEAVSYDQDNIALAPPNPDVVHVPRYDPWNVYGRSVSPYPGFSLLGTLGSISQLVATEFVVTGFVVNWFVAGKLWPRDVDDGLQPHTLGMVGLGTQLAGPVSALPAQRLLLPQHHGSGLGPAVRRPACLPWLQSDAGTRVSPGIRSGIGRISRGSASLRPRLPNGQNYVCADVVREGWECLRQA